MRRIALSFLLVALACQGILDVDLPGRVTADRLDDPKLAVALVNGVLGDVECAWDAYNATAAFASDEYDNLLDNPSFHSLSTRNTGNTHPTLTATCDDGVFANYTALQIARATAEDAIARLSAWTDEQVDGRDSLRTLVRAYAGFMYVALGEGFDSTAFGDGRILPRDSALARAESWFTSALGAALPNVVNLARVGRARARLDRGNAAGAAADAALVPPGFEVRITRGASRTRRSNKLVSNSDWITVRPSYRAMTVGGVPDPRVAVSGPLTGFGGIVYYRSLKYPSVATGHRLASYKEAQYILAEAQGGAAAVNIINALRDSLSLPHFAGGTNAQILAEVVEERGREFFAEGAIRFNDLVRLGMTWKTGTAPFFGTAYGTVMRLPLPLAENDGVR